MAFKLFHFAMVQNLTKHIVRLRSFDGDSVDIPPSKHPHKIDQKFLDWQPPSPQQIRIISKHLIPEHKAVPANSEAVPSNNVVEADNTKDATTDETSAE